MSTRLWDRAARLPAPVDGRRRAEVALLPAGLPDVPTLFTFMRDAELRFETLRLRIEDTYVSQQHARIFDRGGNWYVEDLGSTNGTFVNEQKLVAPAMLTPGDKIRIGTTIVELRR